MLISMGGIAFFTDPGPALFGIVREKRNKNYGEIKVRQEVPGILKQQPELINPAGDDGEP